MFTSMAKDKIMLKELGADLFSNWDTDVGNEKKKQTLKDYTYIYMSRWWCLIIFVLNMIRVITKLM